LTQVFSKKHEGIDSMITIFLRDKAVGLIPVMFNKYYIT